MKSRTPYYSPETFITFRKCKENFNDIVKESEISVFNRIFLLLWI